MSAANEQASGAGAPHPAVLSARLEEPLNRWLWLVKWFLLIPHFVILLLLGIGVVVATIVAWFAILFTGRYPRWVFDYSVGVFRWAWRVSYYGYGALGTDRYPPFSLQPEPDYPATLDVVYTEQHSRLLTLGRLVLAIPQLIIVGIFIGGGEGVSAGRGHDWEFAWPWSGLVGILVLIVGFALLFTTRYPRGLYDFLLGLDRWVFRVAVYVTLMTDHYPPFRLDGGGDDPGTWPTDLPR
jgi:Domain of unknown function (DUF4389)